MNNKQLLANFAGADYAKPRRMVRAQIEFTTFNLPDRGYDLKGLVEHLILFQETHGHLEIKPIWSDEYQDFLGGFEAQELETPEEIAERIRGYQQYIDKRQAERRAEYEQMKREFG